MAKTYAVKSDAIAQMATETNASVEFFSSFVFVELVEIVSMHHFVFKQYFFDGHVVYTC